MFIQNGNTNSAGTAVENVEYVSSVAYRSIQEIIDGVFAQFPYVIAGLIVIMTFWITGSLFRRVFLAASAKTKLDDRLRILFSRLIYGGLITVGFLAALPLMIPNFSFSGMVAGLGFVSFIIGFAARDIFNDLISGVIILWSEPFERGDYIYLKDAEGEVLNVGLRVTSLKKTDGETIHIPNRDVYSNALVVQNAGAKHRSKIQFCVGFSASVEETKQLIRDALHKINGVESDPEPGIYVTDLTSSGVDMTVYFWVDTDENSPLATRDSVATAIKESLGSAGVTLYPPNTVIVRRSASSD